MTYDVIPEYEGNTFISRLEPIKSMAEVLASLNQPLLYDERERNARPCVRVHYVMRLRRFFAPMGQHLDIEQRMSLVLRQGYLGRNPATQAFKHHQRAARERLKRGRLDVPAANVRNYAKSFAIIGMSGVGKSFCVERVLEGWCPYHIHEGPGRLTQVVWVKVDCPHEGSKRALCLEILLFLDRLLSTNYHSKYGHSRRSAEDLVLIIQNLFIIHAVGVLIIDEIQNLYDARRHDKSSLMNFFVLLVNTIGVPVILIGTLGALPIFNTKFAQARRSSGLGSLVWYPLPRGESEADEWPNFVRRLWRGQWTSTPTALTKDLLDALYEETQGVLDLVVILYMLCQLNRIQLTAGSLLAEEDPPDETITRDVIREVADENFQLVRPMISALRSGSYQDLDEFDDLTSFHEAIDDTLEAARSQTPTFIDAGNTLALASFEEQTDDLLKRLGIDGDLAVKIKLQLQGGADGLSPFDLVGRLSALGGVKAKPKKPRIKRRKATFDPDDLRQIVRDGADEGLDAYASLQRVGHIRALADDFA